MKLLDADAIYLGASAAAKVYLGATEVWAPPATGDGTFAPTVLLSATDQGGPISADTTGCDAFLVLIATQSGNTPEISDSKGGTWTQLATWTGTDGDYTNRAALFLCQNVTGGAAHTFTSSGASAGTVVMVGLDKDGGTIVVDQIAAAITNDASSPYTTNAIVPTVGASLAVAAWNPINYSSDGSVASYDAPFVDRGGLMDGSYWTGVLATATLNGTASTTATMNNLGAPGNGSGSILLNLYCAT